MINTTDTAGTPTLLRTLGLRSLVLFGLAYMTPMIVLGIFGVVAAETAGASASAYLIALVAMLFTASSYGRMAAAYPVSGSAYTYVRRSIDSRVGFLTGWAVLLDYLFLPMVIWLIGAAYLEAQFPAVPGWLWIIAFILVTTVLNVVGIKVADKANYVLMAFQLLVLVLFVALSVGHVMSANGVGALVSSSPFTGIGATVGGVTAGAAIAAYCFLGFDAVTTFTEEAVDPRKNMPRAILLIAVIGGAIFLAVSYTTQLVHPGGEFDDASSAALGIAKLIGGSLFGVGVPGRLGDRAVRVRPGGAGIGVAAAVRDGPRRRAAPQGVRGDQLEVPHAGVQRDVRRHRRTAGDAPRCDHVDVVHQLRGVRGVHTGERVRRRLLLPQARRRREQQCLAVRGGACDEPYVLARLPFASGPIADGVNAF